MLLTAMTVRIVIQSFMVFKFSFMIYLTIPSQMYSQKALRSVWHNQQQHPLVLEQTVYLALSFFIQDGIFDFFPKHTFTHILPCPPPLISTLSIILPRIFEVRKNRSKDCMCHVQSLVQQNLGVFHYKCYLLLVTLARNFLNCSESHTSRKSASSQATAASKISFLNNFCQHVFINFVLHDKQ